jgi:arylsulfatase A-like enzyme/uncharacterized membrane protein YbhN (UPF0104 family)
VIFLLFELLGVALFAVVAGKFISPPWRGRIFNLLKLYLTIRMVWLLLLWPVSAADGSRVPAWNLIVDQLQLIDASVFWTFAAIGAAVRFLGVLASMIRWQLVLRGQEIDLPFWHILGAFLIGRAIGFFLPSTAGLDAYKLYDASRFSGRTVEVTAGTVLEKVLGVTGIFLSFLVALPFGISIFGDNAFLVASISVPLALAIILALLAVLWFPGLVQWGIVSLPLPAKARLQSIVLRISQATAAYRHKKSLVLAMLVMSFFVHFFTAAMYYFMAVAVGAGADAAFWPVVFGSSIQIFATVIGPTIGGIGIREAAQVLTLGSIIGLGAAAVSATLGFWVGEVPTLFGFLFWLARGKDYRPAHCRVAGRQVDYEEAARQALELETPEDRERRESLEVAGRVPPVGQRVRESAAAGLGAGILAGLVIGGLETWVIATGGFGGDAQVLWYGPLAYAVLLGALCTAGGAVLGVLPMDREEIRSWTPSLALLATWVPFGLAITFFRVYRDLYAEQMPPMPMLLGLLAGFGVLAVAIFFLGPRLLRTPLGTIFRPLPALGILAVVVIGGAIASRALIPPGPAPEAPGTPSAALVSRPNLILIMVDTLRADHLSCYGENAAVPTPNLCRLAADGGSIFDGFAHASWTKPSAATLMTSLLPSSHGVMSKPSALSDDVTLIAEVLSEHGYATGGIASNTNLAPSFGFDQGYDEYLYLAPDYLAGARESSSKLILYQIGRRVWFRVKPGLRVGDFYQPATVVNAAAFDFLERHRSARFFLFLHYMDPHDPYFEHPWNGRGIDRATNQEPDPAQAEAMRALYRGEIVYLDRQIGTLLTKLEELGLYDDSVIALVSDHGEEFHEHGGWWHGMTLYEEQMRVPILVKWPKGNRRAPENSRGYVVGLLDVAPTLIASSGARAPKAMQGVDLALDAGERPERNQLVFAEEDHEGNILRAVRTETWKYIEANEDNPRGLETLELYEISEDPTERRNRSGDPAVPVAELRSHADAQERWAETHATEAKEAQLSDSEEEALRALGYLE